MITSCSMPLTTPKYHLSRCAKYGPPERSEEELRKLEKSFVLDCVFVSTLSDDSGRANPKMATAIPPYNAQKDKFAQNYFKCPAARKVLKKTGQVSYLKTWNCGLVTRNQINQVLGLSWSWQEKLNHWCRLRFSIRVTCKVRIRVNSLYTFNLVSWWIPQPQIPHPG